MTSSADDPDRLVSVGAAAGIHRIALPTPFAVGRVNTYLIEDDPLTLIDTGPNSGKSLDELEQGLAALGHRIEDLELLLISHQHMDHLGLTEILARRSGAEVAAFAGLVPWAANYAASMDAADEYATALMAAHGIPQDVRHALRAVSQGFRAWGGPATITRPIADGDVLTLRDRTLEASHRPGHSHSDSVFFDRKNRILLSADHLLERISSIALITPPLSGGTDERPRPLVQYIASLRATAAMQDIDLILPGHGNPFTDYKSLIASRLKGYSRRADNIDRLLRDAHAPRTAYELAHEMWGDVAVTQAYLTLCEVLGHLDLLAEEGRVVETSDGEITRFVAA